MVQIKKNRIKSYFLVAWRELAVIAAVLFLDLFSKFLINKNMNLHEKKVLIKGFFNFYYTLNTEAAVGFDFWLGDRLGVDGLRILFIVFVSVAVAVFAFFLVRGHKDSFLFRLPLALIVGGALGNLYDRIFHRAVRDFIHFEFFGKEIFGYTYFPTFNLADSALVIGVILFMVYFIFFDAKFQKRKEQLKAEKAAAEVGDNGAAIDDSNLAEKEVCSSNKNTSAKTDVAMTTVNGSVATENETAKTDKNAFNNADISGKTTKSGVDIKHKASATEASETAEKRELIAGEDGARAVEVLGSKRNYAKKIVTETVVTETIITETTTIAKDTIAKKDNTKDAPKDTGAAKDNAKNTTKVTAKKDNTKDAPKDTGAKKDSIKK